MIKINIKNQMWKGVSSFVNAKVECTDDFTIL
jgi:hypothetical protein